MKPGSFRTPDGLSLATLHWEGSGPPLYLMHATGFCAALWDPIARALADVTSPRAMDERGHGRSDKPPGDYPWSLFADDLLAWIEAEGTERVFAAGHSAGATAVALAAAREPDRFARILLVDPVLLPPPPERDEEERKGGFGLAERTLRRRTSWPSREAMRESLRGRLPYARFASDVLDLYVEHGAEERPDGWVTLRCPREIESRCYRGAAAVDPWPELAKIRARARVLIPELSGIRPHLRERLARELPGAEIARVSGSHFLPLEDPPLVAREARTLFAG